MVHTRQQIINYPRSKKRVFNEKLYMQYKTIVMIYCRFKFVWNETTSACDKNITHDRQTWSILL